MATGDRQTAVNFICQRCSMPVRLPDSITNMNEHTLAELSLPIYPEPGASDAGGGDEGDLQDTVDKIVAVGAHWTDGNGSSAAGGSHSAAGGSESASFTMLSDPGATGPSTGVSHKIKVAGRLFDMLSGSTCVDQPMCTECADLVVEGLEVELAGARHEAALYRDFVQQLKRETAAPTSEDMDSMQLKLDTLADEEKELLDELRQLKLEEEQLQTELRSEEKEHKQLEEEEQQYWRLYCDYRRQLIVADEDYRSLSNQLEFTSKHLEKLKKTNVFNATFHIWHSGHFGTINNFRLGRLPSVPVEWWEINAAWGQTALLLTALARKIGLTFSKYVVVPFGNHSVVRCIADGRELPLYGDGGFKFIWNPKFDAAMVAFLECLQELQDKIEAGDGKFRLPYKVSKGRLEDPQAATSYSVKIQLNSEEHWTKALKYMLTNLKWAVAWVCADLTLSNMPSTSVPSSEGHASASPE